MPRKRLLASLVAVLALVAGYVAYWFYGATVVRERFDDWVAAARAEGIQVSYADFAVDGFPSSFHVSVGRPRLAAARRGERWDWRGEAAEGRIGPFDLNALSLRVTGDQALVYARAAGDPFTVRTAAPTAVVVEMGGDGRPRRLALDAAALRVSGGDAALAGLTLDAVRVRTHRPSDAAEAAVVLEVTAAGVRLPRAAAALLGESVETVAATLAVVGEPPAAASPRQAAAAWRDNGGRLDIRSFFLRWGRLDLSLNGALALDRDLQPAGELTAKMRGHTAVLQALAKGGRISARDGARIKAVLDLLAKPAADGGPPIITAPLDVREGRLMLGPLVLATLPRLNWPD